MILYARFEKVIQETKTIVSFKTYSGHRVDISKKFIKKLGSGNFYFSKALDELEVGAASITNIHLDELYVLEVSDKFALDAGSFPVPMVKDLIPFSEINEYAEKTAIITTNKRKEF